MLRLGMRSAKTYMLAMLATAALPACGTQNTVDNSTVKVTNGVEITPHQIPALVLLVMETSQGQGICTGTFVNDHQVLTAGHCVSGLDPMYPKLYVVDSHKIGSQWQHRVRVQAQSFVRSPSYTENMQGGVNAFDLAVVDFPAGSSQSYIRISADSPEQGTEFIIAGYGNNHNFIDDDGELNGEGSGTLRAGRNVIASKEQGLLIFLGVPKEQIGVEPGHRASAGSGDSGGPLFVDGQLVGVTSGGGLEETEEGFVAVSFYVDLNSRASRNFLRQAIDTPVLEETNQGRGMTP